MLYVLVTNMAFVFNSFDSLNSFNYGLFIFSPRSLRS